MKLKIWQATKRKSMVLLIAIVVATSLVFIPFVYEADSSDASHVPNFPMMTFDGQYLNMSDFHGDVVVLNFWASWCNPCRLEATEFQEAWEYYKDRDDIQFIGLAYKDNVDNSRAFIDEYEITYINAPDLGHEITDLFGVNAIPTTYIVNPDGAIVDVIYAQVNYETLIERINKQLK